MTSSSPVIKIRLPNRKMNGDYNVSIEEVSSDAEEEQAENAPNLVVATNHEPNIQPRDESLSFMDTWCNNRHNGRKAFFNVHEFSKIDIEEAFHAFGESARGALREVQAVIKAMDDPEKLELEQAIRVNDNNGFNSDAQENGKIEVKDGNVRIIAIHSGKVAQPDNALRWIASWGVGFILVSGALVTSLKVAVMLGLTESKQDTKNTSETIHVAATPVVPKKPSETTFVFGLLRKMLYGIL